MKHQSLGCSIWTVLSLCLLFPLVIADRASAPPVPLPFALVIVPGAAISQSLSSSTIDNETLPYLPEFSAESRATAAAIVKNLTEQAYGVSQPLLFSGGYNIGVRYTLNGTVFQQANNSFAAFAMARRYASEAETMRAFVASTLLNESAYEAIMVEEDSDSTEENVLFVYVRSVLSFNLSSVTVRNLFAFSAPHRAHTSSVPPY